MLKADWRSPDDYEDRRFLDAPGFAYEFLTRDEAFQRDRRKLDRDAERTPLDPADADAFARRWGLRFRANVRQQRRPAPRLVDTRCASDCHYGHGAYA